MIKEMWRGMSDIFLAIVIQAITALIFLLIATLRNHDSQYLFLLFNLMLAWAPLLFIIILRRILIKHPWISWQGILVSFLWLAFLPNSFYLFSDLMHLQNFHSVDVLFDIVMILMFAINGLIVGMISLYWFHKELIKRLGNNKSIFIVAGVILSASFAIYLGRYLRWNSWDVLLNPLTLLFDISNPVFEPKTQTQAFSTTLAFFGFIGSCYLILVEAYKHITIKSKF